jgi:hypothetical protein
MLGITAKLKIPVYTESIRATAKIDTETIMNHGKFAHLAAGDYMNDKFIEPDENRFTFRLYTSVILPCFFYEFLMRIAVIMSAEATGSRYQAD